MKKLYILFILSAFSASLKAQTTWGPPFPLTDSLTDNVNATLSIVPGEMFQSDTVYMLWERNPDPASTGIYARNLKTMAGAFMVAAQYGAHFRHPRVFARGTGDTLFYFSYETDMNGHWDIYYSAFLKNEVAVGPFPFIQSSQNERSLNFGNQQSFSWEKEGSIYARTSTADTVKIASDSCLNPVQSDESYVAYEMVLGSDTGVFYSKYNSSTHLWSVPFPADIYGSNTHPTFGNDSYSQINDSYLFWQHKNGPNWVIKGFDITDLQYLSFNNFAGYNNMSPSFCYVEMITGDHTAPLFHYSTFASDVTGNMEIYVNNIWGDTVYSNISEYSGIDRHPQLFNNLHLFGWGLDNQLFDIWESYRGGHWQLWGTTRDILSGEKTLEGAKSCILKVSPNPFSDKTRITCSMPQSGSVTFDIYDLSGKNINTLKGFEDNAGNLSVNWDANDAAGNRVPAGIYICAVRAGQTILHAKIMRH
ncbi:MAG: T9SS type A sorting domain-containing protein [Bacteroidetes bacterium]|nr:T9SS type A sorting domain-containing protein [Bacteroidota bacterium]